MTAFSDPLVATRAWVESFVVARDVCPFAGREVARERIRYLAVPARDREAALLALFDACRHLDETSEVETTLLVLSEGLDDFDDYLDLLEVAEALLAEQGYEGTYQLASFHPDYVFADTQPDDPANFTNRSPFPMWHLLREASVERALAYHPDPAGIPEGNIAAMRALGHPSLFAALARLRG
ncbi:MULTISPECIES: DUF1415 domain-containing protein [Halomonas]|uniref:DUF1415 domain-containing protein n=1 Tax=Halomonas ventosae TaxID=229007 RepID=A0A4R6H261_9GAMM|nr:DUF1415 domain-containing protein [Halomonas ventosae]TDO01461.1 hypothetical protein DFO68_1215 [Halomonas ventosae]